MAPPPAASSGLLSNVFSFVSRELESFVSNATGGSTSEAPETLPEASGSRVKLSRRPADEVTFDDGGDYEIDEREQEILRVERRTRKGGPPRIPPNPQREARMLEASSSSSVRAPKRVLPGHRSHHDSRVSDEERSTSDESRSPSPPPLHRRLRRRPSVTMPGSLFPRSDSLEPDSPPPNSGMGAEKRRVHFAPGITSPSPRRPHEGVEDNVTNSSRAPVPQSSSSGSRGGPCPDGPAGLKTPLRPKTIPSVQDAVRRFQASDDTSTAALLLPNTPSSPGKGKGNARIDSHPRSISDAKGRETRTELPERSSLSKGKGKEYLDLPTSDSLESNALRSPLVLGKERELSAAREEHRRKERDWERDKDRDGSREEIESQRNHDKERIKLLEDEVRRLKDELARRPLLHTMSSQYPPPPPPPPPPPLDLASRAPLDRSSGTESVLASVRASLKHAGPPVEAPINASSGAGRAKRMGQPTVNVATDKMAAFLQEVKTVRLRKVSSGAPGPVPPAQSTSRIGAMGRSISIDGLRSCSRDIPLNNTDIASRKYGFSASHSLGNEAQTGDKRKRDMTNASEDYDVRHPAIRRRSSTNTAIEPAARFASTSTSASIRPAGASNSAVSKAARPTPSSFSQSYPPPSKIVTSVPYWPSVSATETDLTTPSLCSDYDLEGDTSQEDRLLRTPPTGPTAVTQASSNSSDDRVANGPYKETTDVRMEPQDTIDLQTGYLTPPGILRGRNVSPHPRRTDDMFAKRLPTSPMPVASPRRPRPPGRILSKPLSRSQLPRDKDLEEDPLSLSVSVPEDEFPLSRNTKSSTRPRSTSRRRRDTSVSSNRSNSHVSSRGEIRGTLDEELHRADASLEENGDADYGDLESGVLVGVGTRSKRTGFLAHGGAGGIPVHMGEGYVQDVGGEDEDWQPRRKVQKKSSSIPKRKNKR